MASFFKKLASNSDLVDKAVSMGNQLIDKQFNNGASSGKTESATEAWAHAGSVSDSSARRALFIGINYVGQKGELRGCHADVDNLKRFAQEKCKFSAEHTRVLMDVPGAPADQSPTHANIVAAMRWLVEGSKAGDSLFLHYSGHGSRQADKEGDEGDGNDETICPVDYESSGMITDDEMHGILCDKLPAGVKLTAIFDCCHSGSALDLPFTYSVDGNLQIVEIDNRAAAAKHALKAGVDFLRGDSKSAMRGLMDGFKTLAAGDKGGSNGGAVAEASVKDRATDADVVLFSGCMDTQTSADAKIEGKNTGAMSHAFITAMEKSNFNVTYKDLLKSIREILSQGSYEQIPQMSAGRKLTMDVGFTL